MQNPGALDQFLRSTDVMLKKWFGLWICFFYLVNLDCLGAFESQTIFYLPKFQLAQLSDSASCRASWGIFSQSGGHGRVCVPAWLWTQIVSSSDSIDRSHLRLSSTPKFSSPALWAGQGARPVWKTYPVVEIQTGFGSLASWRRVYFWIEAQRIQLSNRIADVDRFGVFRQLVLGEKITEVQTELLRLLGFVHLTSGAGIHLYALVATAYGFFLFAAGRVGLGIRSSLRAARISSALLWVAAWLLSGMRAGWLRPWLVITLRVMARYLGFRWNRFAPLFLALTADGCVALIYRSWAPGRWHYALAVAGGLMAMEGFRRPDFTGHETWKEVFSIRFKEHSALAIGSWVFPALWDACIGHFISPLTPIWSLITIPVFATLFYPALMLSAGLSAFLDVSQVGTIVRWGTTFLEWLIAVALKLPCLWAVDFVALVLGAVMAMAILFLLQTFLKRVLAILVIASAALLLRENAIGQITAPRFVQLDVGQGDAAWLRFRNSKSQAFTNAMIDVGSAYGARRSKWVEFFLKEGVTQLDWIALTHLDEDHRGGLEHLLRVMTVGKIRVHPGVIQSEVIDQIENLGGRVEAVKSGEAFGDVSKGIEPIHFWVGDESRLGKKHRKTKVAFGGNSKMLGTAIDFGSVKYVNFGDASSALEKQFVPQISRWVDQSPVILKLSHHGSRTSSAIEWLNAFQVRQFWISAGFGNRYGHPHREVLERVESVISQHTLGSVLRRTDQEGNLRLEK